MRIKLSELAKVCRGTLCSEDKEIELKGASVDSRLLQEGHFFVAKKGARLDGHDFLNEVYHKGALFALVEYPCVSEIAQIVVKDSFEALREIAKYYRSQLKTKIIGVSGSVGKTSTKEMIASVISEGFKVYKTKGNFNNEVGLPLSLLSITDEEIAVLEMGIDDFGQMDLLASIALPDVAVLTNIGDCHLENLNDRQGVLKAKSEIFKYLDKDGLIFLNGEDELLRIIKQPQRIIYFGQQNNDDVYVLEEENCALEGSKIKVYFKDDSFGAHLKIAGKHSFNNVACACAIAKELGMSTEAMIRGIEKAETISGRNNIISGKKYTLIDDCYNANPHSMKAALDVLESVKERRVAILGEMYELGNDEVNLHREVGDYCKGRVDLLLCVGELAGYIAERGRLLGVDTYNFNDKEALKKELFNLLKEGDVILLKGSHGVHLEELIPLISEN